MLQVNSMGYLEPGTVLTGNYKYQVVSEIGRGAMAVVYLAKQIDLERPVAVKVLSSELASNTSFVLRFFNEVRTAAALSHPNIIQAYDAGIANDDIYYFAMEYVNGETLLRRLLREGHLEIVPALKYAREIAGALNYGWQRQRLTHGDIKPENIMVNDLDQAKLADFGLAKVTGHEYEGQELMLTPHYASPELIKGQRPKEDCRADIYAFGASLYHLLSGRPPFPGNDGQEVMKRHLQEPVEPLYLRCPGVRPDLSDFIASMLEKNPAGRPTDWTAVLNSLERCIHSYGGVRQGDVGRVRFRRPAGNVRVTPLQGKDAAVLNGSMKPRVRQQNKGSLWWYAALVFSTVLLLFFSYLYWKRHVHQQLDAKMEQAVQENQPASDLIPPQTKKTQTNGQERAGGGQRVSSTDVQKAVADVFPEESAPAFAGNGVAPVRTDVVAETAPELEEAATMTGNANEEPAEETTLPEPPSASATAKRSYPDYSLWGRLTEAQRQIAGEVQAWHLLASFQHVPGQSGSAEKMMRLLELWLQSNPGRSSFSELIEFVQRDVVPLLDEGPSRLLLNKEVLLGQTFTGRNNLKLTVLDVLPGGLKIDLILDKGTMRRDMSWREVMDAQLLLEFYRVAFFEPKVNGKPELYLAQLLFSRNSKAFQAAVRKYAASGWAQSSRWEELGGRVNLSDRDLEALKWFAELTAICQRGGSRYEAGRIARRLLLRVPPPFGALYREFLEVVLSLCEDLQPDIQGGRLVREGQELLLEKPDQALARLLTAQYISAQTKYPEKGQISSLQEKAIDLLAFHASYRNPENNVKGWPFLSSRGEAPWPFYGYAWAVRLKQGETVPESLQKSAMLLAHLEAGNWGEVFGKESLLDAENLPAGVSEAALPALLYGRSLMQWRNGDEESAWQGEMQRLHHQSLSEHLAPDAKALIYEYAVLCRRRLSWNELQMLLAPPNEFWLGGNPENLPRRVRMVLTGLLENRQYQRALELNRTLLSRLKEGNGKGGFSAELLWLQVQIETLLREKSVAKKSAFEAGQFPFFQGMVSGGGEYQFRLQLAAMGESSLSAAADRPLLDFFTASANGWQLIGGDAIFDWLLRRVAWQISVGDITLAFQLCDQIVALQAPCLYAYYPRIHLLRGALLCLNGQTAVLTDIYNLLRNCAASSELEKRLLKVADNQIQISLPGKEEPASFWGNLLWFCFQSGTSARSGNPGLWTWEFQNGFAGEALLRLALTGIPGTEAELILD